MDGVMRMKTLTCLMQARPEVNNVYAMIRKDAISDAPSRFSVSLKIMNFHFHYLGCPRQRHWRPIVQQI